MPNINKVILAGHLTRDPELRYLPNNTPVAGFGLAINRKWKNQQGEAQEEVTFVDCEAFGKPAEVLNEYMKKGRALLIEGRLKLDQWQDKEGQNRSKLKVIIESFHFVGGAKDGPGDAESDSSAKPAVGRGGGERRPSKAPAGGGGAGRHEPITDDSIPFHHDHHVVWG